MLVANPKIKSHVVSISIHESDFVVCTRDGKETEISVIVLFGFFDGEGSVWVLHRWNIEKMFPWWSSITNDDKGHTEMTDLVPVLAHFVYFLVQVLFGYWQKPSFWFGLFLPVRFLSHL